MLRVTITCLCLGGLLAVSGTQGQDKKPAPARPDVSLDVTAKLLATLNEANAPAEIRPGESPLAEIIQVLNKRHALTIVIREDLFRAEGLDSIWDHKATIAVMGVERMNLRRFLMLILKDVDGTYLVRDGQIEIVPRHYAERETGISEAIEEAEYSGDSMAVPRAVFRTTLPLVSLVVKDRPLDEVIIELARNYDLNVVISPQTRAMMKQVKVEERLLNVPADTMLELLAAQAGQTVTRKGNTFRIGFEVGF